MNPEDLLEVWVRAVPALSGYVREHRFAPPRRWAFDFAWPQDRVAVEVEGGLFGKGGRPRRCPTCHRPEVGAHSSVDRMLRDMEKYNAAASAGWLILRFRPDEVSEVREVGRVLTMIEALLASRRRA